MQVRKPKFDFGDVFTKEVAVTSHGQTFKVQIKGVVAGIVAASTAEGFEYYYSLKANFPSAYTEVHKVEEAYESQLEKEWQKKG